VSTGLLQSARRTDGTAGGFGQHRRLALGAAAVLVLAVFATWLVAFSPVFGVRSVTVRGTHALTAAQVEAAAGIRHGTPLVRLNGAAIAHRVEAALPEVADARVSTSFPSSVVVTVTERVPLGYVEHGQRFALVDRTGRQYRIVRSAPERLPLFVLADGAGARATGAAVATVAAALPARLRAEIAPIQALSPRSITLLLNDHRVITWGSAARSAEKARVLAALLPRTGRAINVTDPDQPYTR
jgi:cell division protein FtsQ